MRRILVCLALLAAGLTGCAANPVTGKTELSLISESAEIELGKNNYGPTVQAQGGSYVLDPALTAYVAEVGQKLAQVSDRPQLPYEFLVVNDSVPNAWALPGGKIAVNRGLLLELNSEAELAAVLGHEIVHAAARHGAQSVERGMLLQVGVAAVGLATQDSRYAPLLVGGAGLGASLVASKYGRDAELEADRYGMHYMAKAGYDPHAAVDLQETFVRLSQGRESNWLEGLFASHPPSAERVTANRATAAALPRGEVGKERYQAKIAGLVKTKQAYAQFDAGRAALAKNDPAAALAAADKAIAIEPREALFHGLKGAALAGRGELAKARKAYDAAIERNPTYFDFYLQRGLLRQQLNDPGARTDLERSVALLPTAQAHHALGNMALAEGNRAGASRHFALAAESNSPLGQQAAQQLARLELAEQPQRYLQAAAADVRGGTVTVAVRNQAPVPVQGVVLHASLRDSRGRLVRELPVHLAQTLAPGQVVYVGTALGPVAEQRDLRRVTVEVRAARVAE